jgi:hypothetical protein
MNEKKCDGCGILTPEDELENFGGLCYHCREAVDEIDRENNQEDEW